MEPRRPEGFPERVAGALPRVRAFLARLLGPDDAVEDLTQEVFVRAIRSQGSFRENGSLSGWLLRTAFRLALDHRDRRRRAPGALETEPASGRARASAAEGREELARALDPLSPVERDVLLRFHQRGESIREIARALALPEGTVKSHLHRARRRLGGVQEEP
jgi:RNA polymerase sigma-70 factor (ECF subfamily)